MVGLIGQQLLGVTTWKLCLCRTISYVKALLTSCINWKCAYQTAYRPRWKNPPCQTKAVDDESTDDMGINIVKCDY